MSDHNLKGKTQTITVTKILPLEAPLPATSDDIPTTMGDGSAPSSGFGDAAGDRARKAADNLESDDAKRSKSGWYSFIISSTYLRFYKDFAFFQF